MTQLPYFAPLLPWQQPLWDRLTRAVLQDESKLAHALLASGMSGIGKREFVWRWVAWQLCHNRQQNIAGACANCQSCLWLKSGTHPDLAVLPVAYLIKDDTHFNQTSSHSSVSNKKVSSTSANQTSKIDKDLTKTRIKIDDIRSIQDFVHHGSNGIRICVFDYADNMTIAAANALLKTLEEPKFGVQLILITDKPDSLLPTIKSRVQQLPLANIDNNQAKQYVHGQLANTLINAKQVFVAANDTAQQAQVVQLLDMSANAPLAAVTIARSNWYSLRSLWLTTLLALRSASRTPVVASDYWQSQLNLSDFIQLCQIMLVDLQRLALDLSPYQKDIDFSSIKTNLPEIMDCIDLNIHIQVVIQSLSQNIQDKLIYDELIEKLSRL